MTPVDNGIWSWTSTLDITLDKMEVIEHINDIITKSNALH